MSNTKLQAARELIEEKRYTEARALLKIISTDPTAQRWLVKLNDIAPEKPQRRSYVPTVVVVVALLLAILSLVYAMSSRSALLNLMLQATQVAQIPTIATIPTDLPSPTVENTETRQPTITPTFTITPAPTETLTPTKASTSTDVPPPTQSADAQAWQFSSSVSPMDDSVTMGVIRDADNPIRAWLTTPTPYLVLRCRANVFEIYINVGTSFDIDTQLDDQVFVQTRWDREEATIITMDVSSSGDAAFFSNPREALQLMLRHDQLIFGFAPYNAGEAAAIFQLAGLEEAIQPMDDACDLSSIGT